MTIPTEFIGPILTLLGTAIMAGITAILRSLTKQNIALEQQGQTLTMLMERVGNANLAAMQERLESLNKRTTDNEADLARIWGIYDAWRGPSAPDVQQRFLERH